MTGTSLTGRVAGRLRLLTRLNRMRRWLPLARRDLQDRLNGTRNPMFPPRRMQLPSQVTAVAERQVTLLTEVGGLEPDGSVLDVGCGPGKCAALLTAYLDPKAGSYEGFDVTPRSIEWAREKISAKHPNFTFRLADLHNAEYNVGGGQSAATYRFPYEDGRFDVALAGSVFTHLQPFESEHYLDEVGRTLRPGGRFLCTWFLLNEESERLIAEGRARPLPRTGGKPARFDHEFTDEGGYRFRSSRPDIPERRLLIYEEDLDRMVANVGLRKLETYYGIWSGREPEGPRTAGQDMVVLERPA